MVGICSPCSVVDVLAVCLLCCCVVPVVVFPIVVVMFVCYVSVQVCMSVHMHLIEIYTCVISFQCPPLCIPCYVYP